MTQSSENERLRRWRLILGGGQADGICTGSGDNSLMLSGTDQAIDNALSALYDSDAFGGLRQRSGRLDSSSPKVTRWLGDIRSYFLTSVVKVMQQDALQRLNLRQMLLESDNTRSS